MKKKRFLFYPSAVFAFVSSEEIVVVIVVVRMATTRGKINHVNNEENDRDDQHDQCANKAHENQCTIAN